MSRFLKTSFWNWSLSHKDQHHNRLPESSLLSPNLLPPEPHPERDTLLFTPFPATRFAMHRIYANRINSHGMSRVFCDLRSQKTPRGTLPVNSNRDTSSVKLLHKNNWLFHLISDTIKLKKKKKGNSKQVLHQDAQSAAFSETYVKYFLKKR